MLGFPHPDAAPSSIAHRRPGPVLARGGMVCAAHPLAVSAGLDALRQGGNAVDAAVAAGLAASVVMPEMCGLGGDLFAIVHAPDQAPVAILGSGIAPQGASLEAVHAAGRDGPEGRKMPLRGPLSIGVPGMPDAYGALLTRFGRRSFGDAAQAAIGLAEDGFPVSPLCAYALDECARLLARHPATAAVLLPQGRAPVAGEILRQPGLARTLRRLSDAGPRSFYEGDTARQIAAFMAGAGGALAQADLAGHATVAEPPITTTYRGLTVCQTGLPSQGLILLEALNIIENAPSELLARGDAAAVHLMAEALKLAFADRLAHAQDPRIALTPLDRLLSKAFAARRFAAIDPARASTAPSPALQDGDTTYLCTADASGMMVSLIQSVSSAFGSGIIAGDTGVLLNNRVGRGFSLIPGHPNHYAPGKKPMSTLNCWSLTDAEGRPLAVGGTPGGDGQPQWGLQMISALVDSGLDAQGAVEAPRWSNHPGTDPADLPAPYRLGVETRLGDPALQDLATLGHDVSPMGLWGGGGGAQIIARDPATGVLAGGSDPRVEGIALGH